MTDLEAATPYLQRLAVPTLEAFTEARAASVLVQEALDAERQRFSRQVAGVLDGVNYWGLFATFLAERYARLSGVERITTTHPLAHHWTVDAVLTVQLKSDTGNLPVDQLVIPGMANSGVGARDVVVLTWDHIRAERFDPAFVQLSGRREIWRRPVAAFVPDEVLIIQPPAPKPSVTSTRRDRRATDTETPPS